MERLLTSTFSPLADNRVDDGVLEGNREISLPELKLESSLGPRSSSDDWAVTVEPLKTLIE